MNLREKRKEKFYESLKMGRRSFLGKTGIMAASAALLSIPGLRGEAKGAGPHDITPHRAPDRYGSAHVTYVPTTENNLGTTRFVGPRKQINEGDQGFSKAAAGRLGPEAQRNMFRFAAKHPLGAAMQDISYMMGTEPFVMGTPATEKLPIPDPERMTKHIKELGLFLRADDVGVGHMIHSASYATKNIRIRQPDGTERAETRTEDNSSHKYVITFIVDQDLRTFLGSTGYDGISIAQSYRSYTATALISVMVASYIRRMGYNARAHHSGNYNMVLAPNMISSGMGELTRAQECVAHPRFGTRWKGAIVSTDLPLLPDTPIAFGVREFCEKCMKCAEECPAKCMSTNKEQNEDNGIMRWSGDAAKCTMFRIGNNKGVSCGRCMKVCPLNNKEDSWFHSLGMQTMGRFPSAGGLLRDMDDMLGYGTEEIEQFKWWIDWPERY